MVKIGDGEYETMIDGVAVRLVRAAKRGYRGGYVSTPDWLAYGPGNVLLADGNGSRRMAEEQARVALEVHAACR